MNPQKSLNSSFKKEDFQSINKNQLNNSSSKMRYSFPRTSRFNEEKTSFSPNKFYQLPSTKSYRATSFGYGDKIDLAKKNFVTPPPDKYNKQSQFEKKDKTGITMAQGRQQIKANDMFYRNLKQSPQPATYSPKHQYANLKYSIHLKLQDNTDKWVKQVPGPGTYSYLDLTTKQKAPLSKHYSVTSGKFDMLPRLSETEMKRNKNPGPNEYKNTAQILNQFKYFKKSGNAFTRGQRLGIINKSITPGPGNYDSFSSFS